MQLNSICFGNQLKKHRRISAGGATRSHFRRGGSSGTESKMMRHWLRLQDGNPLRPDILSVALRPRGSASVFPASRLLPFTRDLLFATGFVVSLTNTIIGGHPAPLFTARKR